MAASKPASKPAPKPDPKPLSTGNIRDKLRLDEKFTSRL